MNPKAVQIVAPTLGMGGGHNASAPCRTIEHFVVPSVPLRPASPSHMFIEMFFERVGRAIQGRVRDASQQRSNGVFLLYAPETSLERAVRAALPYDDKLRSVVAWADFERASACAGCLIVGVPRLAGPELVRGLARIRGRNPYQPLIVVASKDADMVRALVTVGVSALLWPSEIAAELWTTLCRIRGQALLCEAAIRIEESSIGDSGLRSVVCAALRSATPPRSVHELAVMTGCHRTTLWHRWQQSFGVKQESGPAAFVRWMLFIHACWEKRAGHNWATAAELVGVHEQTVARLARRLLGCTLRETERLTRDELMAHFERGILQTLVSASCHTPAAPLRKPDELRS